MKRLISSKPGVFLILRFPCFMCSVTESPPPSVLRRSSWPIPPLCIRQVILAGYSDEMKRLISSNPGVRSRFPTTIEFADYSAEELFRITDGMLKDEQLCLSPDAKEVCMPLYLSTDAL